MAHYSPENRGRRWRAARRFVENEHPDHVAARLASLQRQVKTLRAKDRKRHKQITTLVARMEEE